MTTVSISVLKARLSEFLDKVRRGEELIVTDRGRPVARILGAEGLEGSQERRYRLVQDGVLSPARESRPDALEPPPGEEPAGVLAALLEERDETR